MNLKQSKLNDIKSVAESISCLPRQMEQVLADAKKIKIPSGYIQKNKITQIVVNGMGGSNLGAGIIKSVFANELKIPLTISPGYNLPAHADKNTLYIISSYSGNTEEPLSTYGQAKKRNAKIIAITSKGNGRLEKMMTKNKIPGYVFEPQFNPADQPRLGLGYSIFGTMILLAKSGFLKINGKELKEIIAKLKKSDLQLRPNAKNNQAKKIAKYFFQKEPVLVAGEFLIGNLRVLRNQLCENSKNFSTYLTLPELNHYAMEGLANPKANKKEIKFLFFNSQLYHPRVQKRSSLTKKVVQKNKVKAMALELKGKTKLEQSFAMLQLGTWITYYLGILNKVNPKEIVWVDWFKKQLG